MYQNFIRKEVSWLIKLGVFPITDTPVALLAWPTQPRATVCGLLGEDCRSSGSNVAKPVIMIVTIEYVQLREKQIYGQISGGFFTRFPQRSVHTNSYQTIFQYSFNPCSAFSSQSVDKVSYKPVSYRYARWPRRAWNSYPVDFQSTN